MEGLDFISFCKHSIASKSTCSFPSRTLQTKRGRSSRRASGLPISIELRRSNFCTAFLAIVDLVASHAFSPPPAYLLYFSVSRPTKSRHSFPLYGGSRFIALFLRHCEEARNVLVDEGRFENMYVVLRSPIIPTPSLPPRDLIFLSSTRSIVRGPLLAAQKRTARRLGRIAHERQSGPHRLSRDPHLPTHIRRWKSTPATSSWLSSPLFLPFEHTIPFRIEMER